MEHAKKMILLPVESLERLQTQIHDFQLKSVQTPGTITSRLDAEMNDILNSVVDEREKCAKYSQILQRYLLHSDGEQIINNSSESKKRKIQEEKDDDMQEKNETVLDADIVETVPKKFKVKAARVLRQLRENNDLKWNERGAVFVDGVQIKGANIIDLINDTMRDRKKLLSVGMNQFATALRRAAIAREFIGNPKVWQKINNSLSQSSSSSSPSSSSSSSSKTICNLSKEEQSDFVSANENDQTPKRDSKWSRLPRLKKKKI